MKKQALLSSAAGMPYVEMLNVMEAADALCDEITDFQQRGFKGERVFAGGKNKSHSTVGTIQRKQSRRRNRVIIWHGGGASR